MLAQLLKETKNKITIMYVKDTTKNRHSELDPLFKYDDVDDDDDDDDYKLLV